MKTINTLVGIALLGASLGLGAAPAGAAEGVLLKVEAYPGYCHMQFPAIVDETLGWDRPVLQDASTTDIVDFYGPCDYDPLGKDEIRAQKSSRPEKIDGTEG